MEKFNKKFLFSFGLLLLPFLIVNNCYALPTPDVLLNAFQIFPIISGAILGTLTVIGIYLKTRITKFKDPVKSLMVMLTVLFICLLICLIYITFGAMKKGQYERIENTEIYFRSDIALDQMEIDAVKQQKKWFVNDLIKEIKFGELKKFSDYKYKPILIDLDRLKLRHDTGFLSLVYNDNLEVFNYIYASELNNYLNRLINEDINNIKRPIIFYNWDRFTIWRSYDNFKEIANVLSKFSQVYSLNKIYDRKKIADQYPFLKICIKNPLTGKIEATERKKGIIKFPVRTERIVYNEKYGYFPNIFHLIPTDELISFIKNDDILLVAPFNSLYRNKEIYQYYLKGYFKGIDQTRIKYIDFNSPKIRVEISQLASMLYNHQFITIGLAKQDWVYMGLDVAHQVWIEYGRKDPNSFKYLGSSVQTPKLAAIMSIKESSFFKRAFRKFRKIIVSAIKLISNNTNLPIGYSILLIAVILRLLLYPIGYYESRSRLIRNDLKRFITQKTFKAAKYHYLSCNEEFLSKKLGCNKLTEAVGTIISLMLILPFFTILSKASFENYDTTFLWISNISHSSITLALFLISIIAVKLIVSNKIGILTNFLNFNRKELFIGICLVFFFVVLSKIPSSIVIFAIGVLGTQSIIDIIARLNTINLVRNTLIPSNKKDYSNNSFDLSKSNSNKRVVRLENSFSNNTIGNKGKRLGELSSCNTNLFTIPQGVILTPDCAKNAAKNESYFYTNIFPEILHKLNTSKKSLYAVRSCGQMEDSSNQSLAGKFETVLNVDSKAMLSAINTVYNSFDVNSRNFSSIIIQEMADVDIAGVLFTQSPHNRHLTSIEFTLGLADSLVSGETDPIQVSIGNWSGTIQKYASNYDLNLPYNKSKIEQFYKHLFVSSKYIEEKYHHPQDIEWGYSFKNNKLYIIQSRDVVAFVDDAEMNGEQRRILTKTLLGRSNLKLKTAWTTSDLIEVVNSPSIFTISLMKALYSNSGSHGAIMRKLGYNIPIDQETFIEDIFGRFYNKNFSSRKKSYSLTNTINNVKLKYKILKDFDKSILFPIQKQMSKIQSLNKKKNINVEKYNNIEEIASKICNKINCFLTEIYALSYEINFITNYTASYLSKKSNKIQQSVHTSSTTKTTELFIDLSKLNSKPEFIDKFINKWGHRSENDYDLAKPSFSEDPKGTINFSSRFNKFHENLESADSQPVKPNSNYSELIHNYKKLIYLKELSKDESLKYLRSIKPLFLKLASVLKISENYVFNIKLEEIFKLKTSNETYFGELIEKMKEREGKITKLLTIDFPDIISIENIEFLSNEIFSSRNGVEKDTYLSTNTMGTMVSVEKEFQGKLKYVYNSEDYNKIFQKNDIIVTKYLKPELTSVFTKVSGCISEKGGRLSHAAIVAREMKFPILVGVKFDRNRLDENTVVRVTKSGEVETEIN